MRSKCDCKPGGHRNTNLDGSWVASRLQWLVLVFLGFLVSLVDLRGFEKLFLGSHFMSFMYGDFERRFRSWPPNRISFCFFRSFVHVCGLPADPPREVNAVAVTISGLSLPDLAYLGTDLSWAVFLMMQITFRFYPRRSPWRYRSSGNRSSIRLLLLMFEPDLMCD
jgi:hypothetical protein